VKCEEGPQRSQRKRSIASMPAEMCSELGKQTAAVAQSKRTAAPRPRPARSSMRKSSTGGLKGHFKTGRVELAPARSTTSDDGLDLASGISV
jgi:hypothetical protein